MRCFNTLTEIHSIQLQAETYVGVFLNTSRNARITRLKMYATWRPESKILQEKLLSACQEHFVHFSSKDACFSDLFPAVAHLRAEHQAKLLDAVSKLARSLRPRPNHHKVVSSPVIPFTMY